jgi:hypothetical protein
MPRSLFRAFLLPLLLTLPFSVQAQPAQAPVESVTVTAAREAAIAKFIKTRAAPTRMTGKIARWQARICPLAYGIPAAYSNFVVQRVREVAKLVGARTNADEKCRGNIQIVFTTKPQELLDNLRRKHSGNLGYYDTAEQAREMTVLKRPVHAYYATQTADLRGNRQLDTKRTTGITVTLPGVAPVEPAGGASALPSGGPPVTLNLPSASAMSVTGSRALGDGLMSEFQHITIVVDTAKVIALEMGSLADYIAMLALSQPQNFDTCQDLPSITNLLVAPACSAETTSVAMSVHDLSYLDGLYKMNIAGTVHTQRSEIGYQMKQVQEGK